MKKTVSVLLSVLLVSFSVCAYGKDLRRYDIPLDWSLQDYVVELCNGNSISPELVLAVIEVESCYQSDVVSKDGNYVGLMQVHKSLHKDLMDKLGYNNVVDVESNIAVGVALLKQLFEKYEDVGIVLMAYNGGESYAQELMNKGIYGTSYSRKVLRVQEKIYAGKQ